jgi:hypothetical protein
MQPSSSDIQGAFDRVRRRIVVNERGCWIWQGAISADSYGQIKVVGTKNMSTHRVCFLAVNGEIPRGKVIRHTCDERKCCNPAHLVIGDHEDNTQDIVDRKRHNSRRVLTAEEVQSAREMWTAGATKRAIAEALRCNWYAASAAVDEIQGEKRSGRPKGSRNAHVRVTEDMKAEIRQLYATGKHSQMELSKRFGCHHTYVSLIVRGKK